MARKKVQESQVCKMKKSFAENLHEACTGKELRLREGSEHGGAQKFLIHAAKSIASHPVAQKAAKGAAIGAGVGAVKGVVPGGGGVLRGAGQGAAVGGAIGAGVGALGKGDGMWHGKVKMGKTGPGRSTTGKKIKYGSQPGVA